MSSRRRPLAIAIAPLALLLSSAALLAGDEPLPDQFASIDDTVRFVPSTQPEQPAPQRPPPSTPQNVDTGRPPHEWQRLTDDWGGARPWLEDRGVAANASFTADYFHNLRGGANTRDADFPTLWNVNLTLDTQRLFGLRGGTFFVNYQHVGGDDPTENVGAFQPVSNIANTRRDQISEIWYEQYVVGDASSEGAKFRVKLGKIDANTEFDNSDYGGEFLNNSSASVSPTTPGFASFPDQAFGGVASAEGEHLYARLGLLDGSGVEGKTTGDDGPHSLFGGPADLLWLGELGVNWTLANLEGHVAIGITYHTGTFPAADGGARDGAVGSYLVLEQQLTKENPGDDVDEQGLRAFARAGLADPDVSEARAHVGLGVTYTGPIPGRDDDVGGVAVNWVTFGHDPAFTGGDEVNVEAFYKVQITRYFSLKPDVQYVHHPGGDAALDDAIAAGVRLDLQF